MNRRIERINFTIRKELGNLITTRLSDPRLAGIISVTRVETARDLANARVFVSILGNDEQKASSITALNQASGLLSHGLNKRVRIRRIPKLQFVVDSNIEEGSAITKLIDQIVEKDQYNNPDKTPIPPKNSQEG